MCRSVTKEETVTTISINDPAVLKRAKEICKKDGFQWDGTANMSQVRRGHQKIKGGGLLSDAEKGIYLEKALKELLDAAGG